MPQRNVAFTLHQKNISFAANEGYNSKSQLVKIQKTTDSKLSKPTRYINSTISVPKAQGMFWKETKDWGVGFEIVSSRMTEKLHLPYCNNMPT